jgi:hypothetical protein
LQSLLLSVCLAAVNAEAAIAGEAAVEVDIAVAGGPFDG